MASFFHRLFLTSFLLIILFTASLSAASSQPKALVVPLSKDTSTLQYIINIHQRTPSVSIPATIDLGGQLLWVNCGHGYVSSTYRQYQCNSPQCALTNSKCSSTCNKPSKPNCNNTTCTLTLNNPFSTTIDTTGQLVSDVVRINSTDGSNLGKVVSASNFLFGCGHTPLQGLAKGVKGIAGFGKTKVSVPSQFSSSFEFVNKFALCLNSNWSTGVAFFGDSPYTLYPAPGDVTTLLSYTPLIVNPASTSDYYIGVTAIQVNKTTVPLDKSLLVIDNKGNGGTMISTVQPYTVLRSSIYKAVTSIFDRELVKYSITQVKRVKAVAPFTACYDINSLFFTRIGVVVPDIKLIMQSSDVVWTIFGNNAMVQVNRDVLCLGFVDGGVNAKAAIVIGGYQMENNLVQFDLAKSRLGFSSSLQNRAMTTCGNFNFTAA